MGNNILRVISALLGVYASVAFEISKKSCRNFIWLDYVSIAPTEPVLGEKNTAAELCSHNPGLINTVEQEQQRIHQDQRVNHSKA